MVTNNFVLTHEFSACGHCTLTAQNTVTRGDWNQF